MIKLLSDMGEHKIALRFLSWKVLIQFEIGRKSGLDLGRLLHRLPIDKESYAELKALGYKLCMVSTGVGGAAGEIRRI